ncbi:hypothetical protein WMF37_11415 [Sorangium sp. So ce291]|uniref:hypothetical protein n=1 Tax=Sorangium sp. So ce291 TaxID=3133294 RepID=UPI003F648CBD
MEIVLDRAGGEVRASARGNRGEQTAPHPLGPDLGAEQLGRFSAAVREAAARGRPLGTRVETAQELHRAVLRDGIDDLRARLGEAAGGPLLVRLMIHDPGLEEVPWEALAAPGEAMRFWGTSPDLLPVRGVTTAEPWQPREVRGAVRVLAIAPPGGAALAGLKEALAGRAQRPQGRSLLGRVQRRRAAGGHRVARQDGACVERGRQRHARRAQGPRGRG